MGWNRSLDQSLVHSAETTTSGYVYLLTSSNGKSGREQLYRVEIDMVSLVIMCYCLVMN